MKEDLGAKAQALFEEFPEGWFLARDLPGGGIGRSREIGALVARGVIDRRRLGQDDPRRRDRQNSVPQFEYRLAE
tara:strand:+ start:1101 stop:1325 length:225 start_codon:yes stop_codon:yes gene_type:complete